MSVIPVFRRTGNQAMDHNRDTDTDTDTHACASAHDACHLKRENKPSSQGLYNEVQVQWPLSILWEHSGKSPSNNKTSPEFTLVPGPASRMISCERLLFTSHLVTDSFCREDQMNWHQATICFSELLPLEEQNPEVLTFMLSVKQQQQQEQETTGEENHCSID